MPLYIVASSVQSVALASRKWLYGMYLVVTARKGISSYQLAKELGITQKSSWFMGHRIRKACKNNDAILSGIIEMDETGRPGENHRPAANH
jgi:hypothetical protein